MISPERRVDDLHILNRHILTIRDVHITRAHGLHIRTLGIILTADPELFPIFLSVTIDRSRTRNGKTVHTVSIYQSSEIVERLSFHTGLDNLEIADAVRAFQLAPLFYQEMGLGLEKERTAEESTTRNHDDAPTLLGTEVYHSLQFLSLNTVRPTVHTVVGHHIPLQPREVNTRGI